MRTPSENWRRSRGVIIGPGLGLVGAAVMMLAVPDAFAPGMVTAAGLAAGLVAGALFDVVRRRRG